ncbi:hypothetical protein AAFF_G00036970 [Aldrovandia affinis]|uniref:Uncharacterized protein n=1 Tax=Aldrovandia affinis TaxID=143900 RepID=A0AAD7WZ95_9TELE|nr:hypothetical protein AAFF_G00036970 [Aldrovandia affinis]
MSAQVYHRSGKQRMEMEGRGYLWSWSPCVPSVLFKVALLLFRPGQTSLSGPSICSSVPSFPKTCQQQTPDRNTESDDKVL